MKHLLFVLILFPNFCLSQANDTLEFYRFGLRLETVDSDCKKEALRDFKIKYSWVAGCLIDVEEAKKWQKHNQEVEKQLVQRYGKNWMEQVNEAEASCKANEIISQKIYKSFDDTSFENGDLILAPEIIFFSETGLRIPNEYDNSLKKIANFIKNNPDFDIEIGIHTDSRGYKDYNQKISEHRGKSLDFVLITRFDLFNASNYSIKGYGESDPVIPIKKLNQIFKNKIPEYYHQINNRIEIKVLKAN